MNQYAKGCAGAAWDDIVHSPGWVSRVLLLGLINLVPILNFVVMGYGMRWGRELLLGRIAPMPQKIFGERTFVNGVFAFVVSIIIGIATYICCAILGVVPLLGALAAIAATIFMDMFAYVMIMRVAIYDDLGAGFDIRNCWEAFKKNPGSLFCASILPNLIVGAIAGAICLAIIAVFALPLLAILVGTIAAGESVGALVGGGLSLLTVGIPALLLVYVVLCFAGGLGTVWTLRAMGHYVAREAQDWV